MKMELRSKAIDKLYRRRDRVEMPEFQREKVWSEEKKRLLIDTILQGWHLPKLYFRKIDEFTFECVDGQQRLTAIWEFYDNKLELSADAAKRFGGKHYEDLPDKVSDELDDFELDIEEIQDADDAELEELFQRLQLGEPLNTPERLNAIHGDMRDFVKSVANHNFFKQTVSVKDTRFTHFDIAGKWVFVEARGVQPQMRFPQLESLFKDNRTYSTNSDSARIIKTALKYLHSALPTRCEWLRNRANVLSVCMLATAVAKKGLDKGTAQRFGNFVTTYFQQLAKEVEKGAKSKERELLDYQQAISYGSTGGDSIGKRLTILTRRLAVSDSSFAGLLGGGTDADETGNAIAAEGEVVRALIYAVNEKYGASNGEDLFKSTNASVASMQAVGELIRDAGGYGKFVDSLYKLFYEGSGSCNRLPSPPPAFSMEIKHLRTGIRHDVDHGDAKKAASKRREIGTVFEKYSGKKTPAECGPEDFALLQLRLLKSARHMLEAL